MSAHQIAVIGGGNMGRALVGGLLRRGIAPRSIAVGEPSGTARASLEEEFGCAALADNEQAISGAAVVVLAVKPQEAARVVAPLRPRLIELAPVVLSVAAGIETRSLEAWCGAGVPVVRAMPNRPALVGAGATGLFARPHVGASDRERAETVMRAVGAVVWVSEESQLDLVTALSGSGPAYFFLLAETMMQAAARRGLDPEAARVLAIETLHGAGALAHASGDLARLRAEVTSKGGTTEAALRVFGAEEAMSELVQRAIDAAAQRGRELARQFGASD
ncbi:MAG: pyrroline-5-carboxylate reductase [Steroidobacteraceae bacterium]